MRSVVTSPFSKFENTGFSLVELLVAVLILSIATVGLFRVFDQTIHATGSNRDRVLASLVARNRAEELQAGLPDLSERAAFGGRNWQVTTEVVQTTGGFEEIKITVAAPAGAAVQLTTYLTGGTLR